MEQGRVYQCAYFSPLKDHKRLQLQWLRDVPAFVEISSVMIEGGYKYGGLILNFKSDDGSEPVDVDTSFLGPADDLVLATRPPLDETPKAKKPNYASHTSLENMIREQVRRYFAICSRRRVRLTDVVAGKLAPQFANRADIKFNTHVGAFCSGYAALNDPHHQEPQPLESTPEPGGRRVEGITVGYLVRIRQIYPDGPGLLVAFGMGGVETLVWAYLLRTRFRQVLMQSEFFMAEIEEQELPTPPFSTLSFADQWKVTPLLEIPARPVACAPRRRERAPLRSASVA